jgi:hypothetical protein
MLTVDLPTLSYIEYRSRGFKMALDHALRGLTWDPRMRTWLCRTMKTFMILDRRSAELQQAADLNVEVQGEENGTLQVT